MTHGWAALPGRSIVGAVAAGLLAASVGGCSAATGPASAAPAGRSASVAAGPGHTLFPLPEGTPVPPGWQLYRNDRVHVLLAVPPGWTADESTSDVGEVTLSGSPGDASLAVTLTSKTLPSAGPPTSSVLLRRDVSLATRACEMGRRVSEPRNDVIGGLAFATATATCTAEGKSPDKGNEGKGVTYQVGTAVARGRQWTFVLRSDSDAYDSAVRDRFTPMLKSLVM